MLQQKFEVLFYSSAFRGSWDSCRCDLILNEFSYRKRKQKSREQTTKPNRGGRFTWKFWTRSLLSSLTIQSPWGLVSSGSGVVDSGTEPIYWGTRLQMMTHLTCQSTVCFQAGSRVNKGPPPTVVLCAAGVSVLHLHLQVLLPFAPHAPPISNDLWLVGRWSVFKMEPKICWKTSTSLQQLYFHQTGRMWRVNTTNDGFDIFTETSV